MTSDFFPRQNRNRSRRGFSLLEFAIVLGVMGVVLGALWGVVGIVSENVKRAEMKDQMSIMVNGIRSFYTSRNMVADIAGNTDNASVTDYLLRQGVLPAEQVRDRTLAVWVADHPWGRRSAMGANLPNGGIAVSGRDAAGVNISTVGFTIELRGLKFSSCVAMISKLAGNLPTGLRAVNVNGAAAMAPPFTADKATVACAAAADNTVAFQYRLREQVQ